MSNGSEIEGIAPSYEEDDEVFVETQKQHWKNVILKDEFQKLKKRSKHSSSSNSRDSAKRKKGRKKSSNRHSSEVLDSLDHKIEDRAKRSEAQKTIKVLSKQEDLSHPTSSKENPKKMIEVHKCNMKNFIHLLDKNFIIKINEYSHL